MDDRDRIWEARADRAYSDLTERPKRTVLKWVAVVVAIVLAIGLVGGCVSWIGGYGQEAKRVTGVENVRDQNTRVIELWQGMEAAAANACGAQSASKEDGDPTLIEDPALAYKATYRTQRAEYNRRMANLYEAQAVRGLPLPSNLRSYPEVAPPLEQKMAEVC